ncbi:MAG TPA: cysteine hydrolase family protein, partial [Alphaproteobacteria bacterium]|nr:cysteine hydrolase family protein [Alphaproteobacteria bacterium]
MKTALILVDIQNDYFPGGSMELVGMREAGSKARELLTFFRENQWPILHIQHIATREGATFFLPDTEGANIHEWVKPLPTETVIRKHHINSFRETRLLDELRRALIEKVVICGAMSHMCIDAATRAAADLGFACVVIHDACATRNVEFKGRIIPASDVHGSFMAALGSYADIV